MIGLEAFFAVDHLDLHPLTGAKDIDAAVNLAASTKRLLSLITDCEKVG